MAFQPFKAITSVINGLKKKSSVLQGPTIPNFSTVASKKGVINYNPTNADYSSPHTSDSNKFFVYPLDVKDQEINIQSMKVILDDDKFIDVKPKTSLEEENYYDI